MKLPINGPCLPIRKHVKPMLSASIIPTKDRKKNLAIDHGFHRAHIIPSIALIINAQKDNTSWRIDTLIASLKDGTVETSSSMRYLVEFKKIDSTTCSIGKFATKPKNL